MLSEFKDKNLEYFAKCELALGELLAALPSESDDDRDNEEDYGEAKSPLGKFLKIWGEWRTFLDENAG